MGTSHRGTAALLAVGAVAVAAHVALAGALVAPGWLRAAGDLGLGLVLLLVLLLVVVKLSVVAVAVRRRRR